MSVNERIRQVRKDNGLTQDEFASRLGLKRNSIAMIEAGRATSDQTIFAICREFGVNETWLRTGVGEMKASKSRGEEMAEMVKNLMADSPVLMEHYNIQSFEADARSFEFYDFVARHLSSIKLIALCTGEEDTNREISDNLMLFLKRRRAESICVVRCGALGVRYQESIGSPILTSNVYTLPFLSAEDADRSAILLNASYDGSDRSDWEKWVACDSFSKMSSRASADFTPAFIRASGSSREEMLAGKWEPSKEMLQNLGETEHLRWNAFHFCSGYRPMSREEFDANAETWARSREEGVPCSVKIAKNQEKRLHACLIPWEELDELSERENRLTGRDIDYKQTDINNVLTLPKLLRAEDKRNGKK